MIVAAIFSVIGCGEKTPEQVFADAEASAADTTRRSQAVTDLNGFLERYPDHQSGAKARKLLAVLAQQDGEVERAIQHYERLLADHPKSEFAAAAQFMVAYIHEEYLKDFEEARRAYQRLIDNFPNSDLATNARYLLPNIGRDPEEWVKFRDDHTSEN